MLSTTTVVEESPSSDMSRPATFCQEPNTQLRDVVQQILASAQHECRVAERRREQRTPYPYLFKLSPAEIDGEKTTGEQITVVGKHLSQGGIDFYHREPLPHRWMVAQLAGVGGQSHTVLVELLWCRFNKQGWYENGGRFLRLVD